MRSFQYITPKITICKQVVIFLFPLLIGLNSHAQFAWMVPTGSAYDDGAPKMDIDQESNMYVLGLLNTDGTYVDGYFADTTLTRCNFTTFFAKLSATGKREWFKIINPATGSLPEGVLTDSKNNSYIAGDFYGNCEMEGDTLIAHDKYFDSYIAKYSPEGKRLWLRLLMPHPANAGGEENNIHYLQSFVMDSKDNLYVSGVFEGGILLGDTIVKSRPGMLDRYITKFNPKGEVLWFREHKPINDTMEFTVTSISCGKNILYASGSIKNPSDSIKSGCIAKFDLQTGEFINLQPFPYAPHGLVIDSLENYYVSNGFKGSRKIGDTVLVSPYEDKPWIMNTTNYLAKFNKNDQLQWIHQFDGKDFGIITMVIDTNANLMVALTFNENGFTFNDSTYHTDGEKNSAYLITNNHSSGEVISMRLLNAEGIGIGSIKFNEKKEMFMSGTFYGNTLPWSGFDYTSMPHPMNGTGYDLFYGKMGKKITGIEPVNPPDPDLQVIVYPNPADQFLKLRISAQLNLAAQQLIIVDSQGKEVINKTIYGETDLTITALAPGIYCYSIYGNGATGKGKFIIQR